MDKQAAHGVFRALGNDPQVVYTFMSTTRSQVRMFSILGWALVFVGILFTLTIIGALIGIPMILGGLVVVFNSRGKLRTFEAAYAEYMQAVQSGTVQAGAPGMQFGMGMPGSAMAMGMMPSGMQPSYQAPTAQAFAAQPSMAAQAVPGWRLTHVVPAAGMRAWAQADPSAQPVANLAPGVELNLLESWGTWAKVEGSNGWTGWVEGDLLQARA